MAPALRGRLRGQVLEAPAQLQYFTLAFIAAKDPLMNIAKGKHLTRANLKK
jgi:hypothetical protein